MCTWWPSHLHPGGRAPDPGPCFSSVVFFLPFGVLRPGELVIKLRQKSDNLVKFVPQKLLMFSGLKKGIELWHISENLEDCCCYYFVYSYLAN